MRHQLAAMCITLCSGAATADAQATFRAAPDLILTGGKIFTSDSTRPWAEALGIRGDRIVAVGSTDEVRRLRGRSTREIALAGRIVTPGFNDAHDHMGATHYGAAFATSTSPTPEPTLAVVLDSLRALAPRTPAGTWLHSVVGLHVSGDAQRRL